MTWFAIARLCVSVTLITGIYMHLYRLIFGMDQTLDKVITASFDSIFAVVLIISVVAIFNARKNVLLHNTKERILFYFTLIYFAVSVPLHVRTWFVPDNTQMLRFFPEWYSVFFLFLSSLLFIGWWKLKSMPSPSRP